MMSHVHDELIIPSYMLGIPNIDILEIDADNNANLVIDVESRDAGTQCHQCGKQTYATDGHDKPIMLRHLSMFNYESYIRIHPIRCKCTCSAITIQRYTWYTQRSRCTILYEDHI
jgi:hypothetical protein